MVTDKQLNKLVELIVDEINPKKIFLIGSYAAHKQTKNSDVDLIVVVEDDLNKKERRNKICNLNLLSAIPDLMFPKDLFLYSLKEYESLKTNSQSFLHGALEQSKNLYDR